MIPGLYGAAALLFVLAALAYFHARFALAGLAAAAYWGSIGFVAARSMSLLGASVALGLLAALPAALLLAHVVDLRRGIFLVPTVYSIPLAFLSGALLWLVVGVALLV